MASTRFRYGDHFGTKEYQEIKEAPDEEKGLRFCTAIEQEAGESICCLPSKELGYVTHPTTVGLGDFFAGGLLPELLADRRI